jgi:hypothetical protein
MDVSMITKGLFSCGALEAEIANVQAASPVQIAKFEKFIILTAPKNEFLKNGTTSMIAGRFLRINRFRTLRQRLRYGFLLQLNSGS